MTDNEYSDSLLPWLQSSAAQLETLRRRGQLPHALLLLGQPGTGREQLGLWLAGRLLDAPRAGRAAARAEEEGRSLLHPDLLRLAPPPDKRVLPIEQVRDMVAFLQLTAHQGGAKIAIVKPAEALSHQAANSLLKTLEEPPAGSLIVLIATTAGRLPATVVSRCQRLRVATPDSRTALEWLQATGSDADWPAVLALAGGAPLRARQLFDSGFADEARRLAGDLEALEARRTTPMTIARRWARLSGADCVDWLYRRSAAEIRALAGASREVRGGHLQYVGNGLNIEPLFAYLSEIAQFRRLQGSGLNAEIAFANLLEPWYGGLRHSRE